MSAARHGRELGPRLTRQPCPDVANHRRQDVDCPQHDIDVSRPDCATPRPGKVEEVLHSMGDLLNRGHAERAGVALDRMEGAEDVVQQRDITRAFVERQERRLDRAQVIQRFGQEQVGHLRVVAQEGQLVVSHGIPSIVANCSELEAPRCSAQRRADVAGHELRAAGYGWFLVPRRRVSGISVLWAASAAQHSPASAHLQAE